MKDVQRTWERARKHFHFPSLKEPKVVKGLDGGACYDFKKRETLVSEDFVQDTCKKAGLTEEQVLEGIFIHEISHYMDFPKTLSALILAAKMIDSHFSRKEGVDSDALGFILQTYADMACDTASVLHEDRTGPILGLRRGLQDVERDELNHSVREVMLAYLMHQAQQPYELKEELKPYLERMLKIDFLSENITAMRLGTFDWGSIVLDMIKRYDGSPKGDGNNDSEIKRILEGATDGQIREALREISGKISKKEFEQVKEWLKEKGARIPKLPQTVKGIGTSEGELEVDMEVAHYYKELSTQYPLVVTKKLMETNKTVRSWSDVERWRPGVDPNLALPVSSGGLFLPGVTRSIRIQHNPVRSTDYDVPHLLVVIDSSGSMPNPKDRKSYAALGGTCGARSYHLHGSSIGVINFSGSSFYLPYTRELDDAIGAIVAFQGGGTVADVDMIRKMLGPEMAELYTKNPGQNLRGLPREAIRKNVEIGLPEDVFSAEMIDVIMFTDGGIFNLDEVLSLFEEKAQLNRATIVLTHGFEQKIEESEKINVHRVEDVTDIPNLIIRETGRNFAAAAEGLL
jgi:hypothetical protein